MKKFHLLLLLFVISIFHSCTVTKGVYDTSLKSTEPSKFIYSGSQSDMEVALKRIIVQNGFSIADFDKEAGIISTNYKDLTDDEKYNMDVLSMGGVNVSSQKGKLLFLYKPEGETIQLELSPFLQVNAQIRENSFSKANKEYAGEKVAQGHPLSMKYRNILLVNSKFTLK